MGGRRLRQFTSQMEYWQKAAQIVGDAPSTLNIVYPEVYLAEGDARIECAFGGRWLIICSAACANARKKRLCVCAPRDRERRTPWAGW